LFSAPRLTAGFKWVPNDKFTDEFNSTALDASGTSSSRWKAVPGELNDDSINATYYDWWRAYVLAKDKKSTRK